MLSPSWLILLWIGPAAALVTATLVAGLPATWAPRGALMFFRPSGFADAALLALAAFLVYPVVYGLIFDYIHAANALAGAFIGILHGAILIAINGLRRRELDAPWLTIMAFMFYGAALGFLYVTP